MEKGGRRWLIFRKFWKTFADDSFFDFLKKLSPTTTLFHGIKNLGLNKNIFLESQHNKITKIRTDLSKKYHFYSSKFDQHGNPLKKFEIHIYTFKNEDEFILDDFGNDFTKELEFWLENFSEVSGYFCDFPESCLRAYNSWRYRKIMDSMK